MAMSEQDRETLTDMAKAGGTSNMVTSALARAALDQEARVAALEAKPRCPVGASTLADALADLSDDGRAALARGATAKDDGDTG